MLWIESVSTAIIIPPPPKKADRESDGRLQRTFCPVSLANNHP